MRESLWGSGRTYNKEVYTKLDTADAAYTLAMKNFRSVLGLPTGAPMREVAARDLVAAQAAREAAPHEYMRLPEEVEAWRIGKETEAAVKERLRLDAALAKAKAAERDAHAAFNKLENPLLKELLDPAKRPSAAAVQAWERAMDRHQRSVKVVQAIMERRHALATTGKTK